MTKDELMQLTIQQLIEYFCMYPECFELEDPEYNPEHKPIHNSTIIFHSKSDPTSSSRAMTIVYSEAMNTITCQIFFRSIILPTTSNTVKPDATSIVRTDFKWFSKSYKLFKKLRGHIIDYKRNQENNEFLNKLHSVFPGTFDDFIFGKRK